MRGANKRASNFNCTFFLVGLLSLLAVVGDEVGPGVSAHGERTSVLQRHSHALPPYRSAHM